MRRFRHPSSFFEKMSLVVRANGGPRRFARKLFTVFREEGLSGLKRRVLKLRYSQAYSGSFNIREYGEWIKRYDTIGTFDRAQILAAIDIWYRRPLISVVMPVKDPPIQFLREALDSVLEQLYPNWELCIADDCSTVQDVKDLLQEYSRRDDRIKIIFRPTCGHIVRASNSALELSSGIFVAFLDHDDRLTPDALYCLALKIRDCPKVGLIYSDEDKIDGKGRRHAPYFKCDWNLDLFLSHNLIGHLSAFRLDLVKNVGGFREGFEGAQDHDLALRCVESLKEQQIVHISKVLYHWRVHSQSTASSLSAKSYALMAGKKAIAEHLQRSGVLAKVECLDFGMYRVKYVLPSPLPLVSLIIPTRNQWELLRRSIDSILTKTSYQNYHIIVVDNGSDEAATLEYLRRLGEAPNVEILRDPRPFNFSALNNRAVEFARGEFIALLNNDVEIISHGWLDEMVSIATQDGVGVVGARLWYPNDTLQHAGIILGIGGVAGHSHKHMPRGAHGYFSRPNLIQSLSAMTGACLLVRRWLYQEVGGLDEENLGVAFNDVDFCLRIKGKGLRNVWTPYAELYHYESASRGYEDNPKKKQRFDKEAEYMKQRWGGMLLSDPAYNRNLTLDHEDFALAWPPREESDEQF